jgi:hypothetical protein
MEFEWPSMVWFDLVMIKRLQSSGVSHQMNKKVIRAMQSIVLAAAVAFFGVGCACLPRANPQADVTARAQIEDRLHQVFSAATAKNFDRLDSYHLYGPKFTKFSGSTAERLDAHASRKGEHDGLGAINGLKMRADDLKIDVFDSVGIATFILTYSFDTAGGSQHAKERTTMVFVKEGGTWKIAHEHLSPVKP